MNRTRTIFLPFLLVCLMWAQGALAAGPVRVDVVSDSGDRIVLDYRIDGYRSEAVRIGEEDYAQYWIPGEALLLEKGSPALPHVNRSVIIPDDAQVTIQVLASGYTETFVKVAPSKGPLPRSVDPDSIPHEFGPVYSTSAFYPGPIAEIGDPYILRDHRGIVVQVNPFQYNPVTGILRIYTDVTIEVTAVGSGGKNVLTRGPAPRESVPAFEDLYRRHFVNYEPPAESAFYASLDEQGDMLIIAEDAWLSNLDSFVAHKASMGINADVVGISTVGNNPASIKSYIQSRYNTTDLAFVLLVGDAAEVATQARQVGAESGASDSYYSKLAGNDDYPEIMVGRFSASTAAEVDTQVERTITYETLPAASQAWFKRGVGIASAQGAGQGDEGQADYQHMDEIRSWLLGDGYTLVDQIYDPTATDTQVTQAVNAGRGIINYCGHGSASSWGTTGFNTADVDALVNDNMLPFIVSVACNNGEFHHYAKCFAEAWLRAVNEATGEPAGAIGMYASSVSQSWAPPMEAQDEFNLRLTDTSRPYHSFGAMCFAGSCSMMDKYGSGGVEMFDTWVLFGDPSLKISGPAGLQVDPSAGLAASGPPGGPYDAQSLTYTLTNNEAAPIDYEATCSQPWVSITNPTGTIPAGGTATVTVVISDASRNLDVGSHTDAVRFRNLTNRSGDTTRPVNLTVAARVPVLRWTLGSDPGWPRNGEWQFGTPTGGGGGKGMNPDPAAGATGANVCGANLAGNISKTIGGPYYLTAGPFDLTGVNGLTLSFQRWLNTPAPIDVASTVAVSNGGSTWTTIWTNSDLVTDAAWTPQSFDISSVTGVGGSVYVRWGYQVKGRVSAAGSGWNIDDVELQGALQSARITLSVAMDQLSWTSLPGMAGYDVVRGDLRTLVTSGGDFTLATGACLGEDVAGTTLQNTQAPAPGEGHWFLVRGVSLSGPMTYQSLAGDQSGLRDAEINAAPASCQ